MIKNRWSVKIIYQGSELKEFQIQWLNVIFGEDMAVLSVNWQSILLDNLITIREPFPAHHSEWMIDRIKTYGQTMKSEGFISYS